MGCLVWVWLVIGLVGFGVVCLAAAGGVACVSAGSWVLVINLGL